MIAVKKLQLVKEMIYTTSCLLFYPYFEKYFNLISTALSKQHKLDAHTKAIQQISFTGNLEDDNTAIIFRRNCENFVNYFSLI